MFRSRIQGLVCILGTAGAVLGGGLADQFDRASERHLPAFLQEELYPGHAWRAEQRQIHDAAARGLSWADEQAALKVGKKYPDLTNFFAEAKTRSPEFAKNVLGWGSKWRYVADLVPGTRGDRYPEHVRACFERHLFAPDDLSRAIALAIQQDLDTLEAIENEMLVRIRQDIEQLPLASVPRFEDPTQLRAAYESALRRASEQVESGTQLAVGQEIVSLVAGEVLAQVAVRMGVSAGILGTGAASSWATFGIGLVVGIIVDQIVAVGYDYVKDPQGHLSAEVSGRLDRLYALLMDGDGSDQGLRAKMAAYSESRSRLRRQAIERLLQSGECE